MKHRKSSLSPPSYLYHLEPLGQGTPYVESLTGYISRLATSHSVSTTALYGYVIAPVINKPYMLNIQSKYASGVLGGHFRHLIKTINGIGNTATEHVKALEQLTLRQDLIYMTLLPWREVLSERRLSRSFRMWCPECFEDQRRVEVPVYEQLLWTLQVIEVCPRHNVILESTCPHCKRDGLPLLASGTRPGYCSDCGQWLGAKESGGAGRDVGHIERLLAATACCELLSKPTSLDQVPRRITVATAVYECISYFAGGSVNDLATAISMSSKTISNWRKGENVPQLDFLINFCQRLGLTLTSVLTGNLGLPRPPVKPARDIPAAKVFKKFIPYDEDKVRRKLEGALLKVPVPSLRTMSKDVGMNCKKLKQHFPRLCRSIVEKYREQHEDYWVKIGEAMDSALKENPPPSLLALASRLGHAKSTLYPRLRGKCHKISERFLQYRRIRSVRAREEFKDEIRSVALELYKSGVYPSERAVSAKFLKPGRINTAAARATLRGIRAELYGGKAKIEYQSSP